MGLTLQQLQQEGATPVTQGNTPSATPSSGQKFSLSQLQGEGATPVNTSSSGGILNTISNKVGDFGNFLGNTAKNTITGASTLAARPGELLGVGAMGALSKVTGDPGYYNRALNAMNTPTKIPGIEVPVKGISQETPESLTGEGLSTVSLGAPTGLPGLSGLSLPVSGAIMGGLSGAGSSMQQNGSPLNVAGSTALGASTGYATGLLAQGVQRLVHGPATLNDSLFNSRAVANQPESDSLQATLSDNGITSLNDKIDVADAKNALFNSLRDAQNQFHSVAPLDAVSGEPTGEASYWNNKVTELQNALRAVTQVGHHVNVVGLGARLGAGGIASGVALGGLASDTLKNTGNFLYNKFVGPNPVTPSITQ